MTDHCEIARTRPFADHQPEFIKRSIMLALAGAAVAIFAVSAWAGSGAPNLPALNSLPPTQMAVDYVVPPTKVSPDHGQLASDNPFYRETQLLSTDHGLIAVFMEVPPNDSVGARAGWTCSSPSGTAWSCTPIDRGPGNTEFGDPWLTDSRGDPCPTYGHGITLAALGHQGSAEVPMAYYSLDFGQTWVGPEFLPYPNGVQLPLADGSKTLFTGRNYIAWRDFTFATGEYISQLQTVGGRCSWGAPIRLSTTVGANNAIGYDDGSDHPRLASTPVPGELAARGSFADQLLTFHRFNLSQDQEYQSIIAEAGYPEDALLTCPTLTNNNVCELFELGTTLMWVPSSHTYVAVYSAYDIRGPHPNSVGLWYKTSSDAGRTWSDPVELAGPSVDQSYLIMQETLAYDRETGDLVLAYYEVPQPGSHLADLKLRVLHPKATAWTPSQTIRVLTWYWDNHGSQTAFGDYFGLQANGGVAHVAEQYYDTNKHISYIEYFSVHHIGNRSN
jgi:hypothetical protein